MLTKPRERSFARAQDDSGRFRRTMRIEGSQWTVQEDSGRFRRTVDGSGGQIGVDENRYEQKKDREEKRDREESGM